MISCTPLSRNLSFTSSVLGQKALPNRGFFGCNLFAKVLCGFLDVLHHHCRLLENVVVDALEDVSNWTAPLAAVDDVRVVDVSLRPCIPIHKLSHDLKLAD